MVHVIADSVSVDVNARWGCKTTVLHENYYAKDVFNSDKEVPKVISLVKHAIEVLDSVYYVDCKENETELTDTALAEKQSNF